MRYAVTYAVTVRVSVNDRSVDDTRGQAETIARYALAAGMPSHITVATVPTSTRLILEKD